MAEENIQEGISPEEAQEMMERMSLLELEVKDLNQKLLQRTEFLMSLQSLQMGNGSGTVMRADSQGMWWGADKFASITGDTSQGTAIGIDGSFYGKDGFTGTQAFLVTLGPTSKTITVVNGLITNIA